MLFSLGEKNQKTIIIRDLRNNIKITCYNNRCGEMTCTLKNKLILCYQWWESLKSLISSYLKLCTIKQNVTSLYWLVRRQFESIIIMTFIQLFILFIKLHCHTDKSRGCLIVTKKMSPDIWLLTWHYRDGRGPSFLLHKILSNTAGTSFIDIMSYDTKSFVFSISSLDKVRPCHVG